VTTRSVVAAAVMAALLTSCSSTTGTDGAAPTSTPTQTPRRPTVTPPDPDCGRLELQVLGVQGGRQVIVGTHAEWQSKAGQFVRVRIYATNLDGTFHTFHLLQGPVIDADATSTLPDRQAMLIKRQSEDVVLGGENQARFDIWFDLPTTAHPVRLMLRQDLDCVRPVPLPPLSKQ
jgi:hypothetical protein